MTDTNKPLKIEPCHHCGSDNVTCKEHPFQAHCGKCGAEGPEAKTWQEALIAWNHRTPDKEVMELVDIMEKYCEGPALEATPFVEFRDKYREILSRLPEKYKRS